MNSTLLSQAKETLAKLDAVFFMEDFGHFADAFKASSLIEQEYMKNGSKKCELGHSNPTACATCRSEPTAEEKEIIIQHNQMDIELYNYASNLPNRFRGPSQTIGLLRRHFGRIRDATKAKAARSRARKMRRSKRHGKGSASHTDKHLKYVSGRRLKAVGDVERM